MDDQLRAALEKGKEDYENRTLTEREKATREAEQRIKRERENEDRWRKRIREEPALLFQKIREARAKGEEEVSLIFGDQQLVTVLREIDGLDVHWESGRKKINSDEVEEDYFWITVKWKQLP